MDSPFSGAMIEGKNINVLKKGSTITLTCKIMESEIEGEGENTRRIEWMKNRELVNIKVRIICIHGRIWGEYFEAFSLGLSEAIFL